ncbi:fused DSP-PTPase phosphatase/NAD kinase-like protein [Roseovarius nitratireducens]|uniref:fused DSP-PTPase phosphatase/NAD kinase-like protein n=1 Tax=Roseovarius nitratireducens TaxID=2044597 RepID=UPI000CE184E5|nr:tyrosine-protein phosphatase [Roseovarius nitratireducens]
MSLFKRISDWERRLRASYNTDLSTPENRRRAHVYNLWFDHAILRTVWTNQFPVAPGVWRSNQPTHARLVRLKAKGVRSILNLRGAAGAAHYLTEKESCRRLGLNLVDCTLQARDAAPRANIEALIAAFREIERPFVMHCKSGADRAGFAAAIYLMVIEGRPVAEARRMLGVKYIHFKWTRTGVLDFILDRFADRHAETGIGFEDWIATEYDHEAIQTAYNAAHKPLF